MVLEEAGDAASHLTDASTLQTPLGRSQLRAAEPWRESEW